MVLAAGSGPDYVTTMSNSEPTDVGPAVGGDRPVSQSDIAQVSHLLRAASADGRLTAEELQTRLNSATNATTFDDLIPLTRDLVAIDAPQIPTVSTGAPYDAPAPDATDSQEDDPSNGTIVAVFGGATRKGNWVVPAEMKVWAVFGGADVDLSDATFTSDAVEITMMSAFGGMTIIVPQNAQVIDRTSGSLFGGTTVRHPSEIDPTQPTIVLKGFAMFGGSEVRPPKKSKRRRDKA